MFVGKTPVRPPMSHLRSMRLELVSSHDTGHQCGSVAHYGDDILVGTLNGLKVFNRVSKNSSRRKQEKMLRLLSMMATYS